MIRKVILIFLIGMMKKMVLCGTRIQKINEINQEVNCNNLVHKCKSGKTTYFSVINKPEELSEGIKTLKYQP